MLRAKQCRDCVIIYISSDCLRFLSSRPLLWRTKWLVLFNIIIHLTQPFFTLRYASSVSTVMLNTREKLFPSYGITRLRIWILHRSICIWNQYFLSIHFIVIFVVSKTNSSSFEFDRTCMIIVYVFYTYTSELLHA